MNHYQFRVAAGTLALTWNSRLKITRLDWLDHGAWDRREPNPDIDGLPEKIADVVAQLNQYFTTGHPIRDLRFDRLDLSSQTEFQKKVYRAICKIPHGETRTYAWVARQIGSMSATRAVGQALRRNPIPIIVPCHRVVALHDMGGFMGAQDPSDPELKLKAWLLDLENSYLNPPFDFLAGADLRCASA